jgi:hypothetical protein
MPRPWFLPLLLLATLLGALGLIQTTKVTPEQLAEKTRIESQRQRERLAKERDSRMAESQRKQAKESQKIDSWYANDAQYSCEIELEKKLKDPGSYKRDGDFVTVDNGSSEKVITWRFRAKNSFGAFDIANAICSVSKKNGGTLSVQTINI